MSNELQVVNEVDISIEVKAEINEDIDRIIEQHKNNRQAINKLVFESVAAMTEADDAQAELSNKGWLKRRIGSITGSNSRLQDRINSNRATAMYASQRTLQKLAEQNLMTFDLIAAVNNKLNTSLIKVDAEFANIYQGLAKFFKTNRSELARIEARLEKVERNINLLNWRNTIEYQEFDGVEYIDLDNVSKIACLVRDFYDLTKGEWSNYDLLLLKTAMGTIEMTPRTKVNYFDVLKSISNNPKLKEYMLDGRTIGQIEDPSYLLSLGCLKKYEMLNDEESYMVDTVVDQMNSMGVSVKRSSICDQMMAKYLEAKAYVNVNVDVECYDLILDLLYNIRQAKDENLLIGGMVPAMNAEELFNLGLAYLNGDGVEQSDTQAYDYFQQAANLGDSDALGILGRCYEDGIGVEQDLAMAMELYLKSADLGNAIAMNDIGDLYYFGSGVVQDYTKAMEWYLKAADYDNEYALNNLGVLYADGLGVEQDYIEALKWWEEAANLDNARAMNNIGDLYANGWGVEQDYGKALAWFQKAADLGNEDALDNIERVTQEMEKQRYGLIATIETMVVFDDSNRKITPEMEKVFENIKAIISKPLRVAGKVTFKNCEIIFSYDGNIGFYLDEGDSEVIFQNCEFKTEKVTEDYLFSTKGLLTFKDCLFDNVKYRDCEWFINFDRDFSEKPAYLVVDHCHIKDCDGTFIGILPNWYGKNSNVIIRDCLVENHTDNFLWADFAEGSGQTAIKIINTNFKKGNVTPRTLFGAPSLIKIYRAKFDIAGTSFSDIEQNIFCSIDTCASDINITDCSFVNCKQRERVAGTVSRCEFNGNKWYGDVVK